MLVGVIGINHKLADLKLREKLARACQRRFAAGNCFHSQYAFILLSTCNRTEVYFSSSDLAAAHTYILNILRREVDEEFEHKLYSFFGSDCLFHLCCVTAGLDSAIVAETEIQGQVKAAYEAAQSFSKLPAELHYLFQKALKISKEVRTKLILGRGMPDVEHAILQTGTHVFKSCAETRLLFVGASEINQKVLHFLKTKKVAEITLCNRSLEKAQSLAEKYQVPLLEWDQFQHWHEYDWIIFGTKAPHYLISKEHLNREFAGQKLIIDLSFPRNVDPKVAKDKRITLLNIDQINRMLKFRKQWLNQTLIQASEMIASATKHQIDIFHTKQQQRDVLRAVGA